MSMKHQTFAFVLTLLVINGAKAIGVTELTPVGYLEASYSHDGVLTPSTNAVINCHLFNVSDAPITMRIMEFEYTPDCANIMLPGNDYSPEHEYDVWGPPTGARVKTARDKIAVSGQASFYEPPVWNPDRPYITLFRNEGYTRKLYLNSGWVNENAIPSGTKALVLGFSPPLKVWLPKKSPDAVVPGKPIVFDEPVKIYAPGERAIPYVPHLQENPTRKVLVGKDDQSGLSLEIQLPRTLSANQDVKLVYHVGNQGKKPVRINQNSLIPAYLRTKVLYAKQEVASFDSNELKMLADLFPERKPVLLFPGEYLSFRHDIPAASSGLKKNGQFEFFIELSPKWYPIEDETQNLPKTCRLTSGISVMAR